MGTDDFISDMAGLGVADIFYLAIAFFLASGLLPRKDGSLLGLLLFYALLPLEWRNHRLRNVNVWYIKTHLKHLKLPESRFGAGVLRTGEIEEETDKPESSPGKLDQREVERRSGDSFSKPCRPLTLEKALPSIKSG